MVGTVWAMEDGDGGCDATRDFYRYICFALQELHQLLEALHLTSIYSYASCVVSTLLEVIITVGRANNRFDVFLFSYTRSQYR